VNVLAIDQGTSATKAMVVAPGGRILGTAEQPVRPVVTSDGGVQQDPGELWESVLEAGHRALSAAGEPAGAVGLANQGETVLAWDSRTGRPLGPALSWQDRRAVAVCERLAGRAAELEAITGLPLDPYFAAPKIAWLREHLTRDGVATTTDSWLLHRLCGAYVTDAATASRWLLLDLNSGVWSPVACAAFGIDPELLPEPVPCAGVVGVTEAFGSRMSVAGLAVDQQAALFGQRCLRTGQAKCTYGTGAFLLANAGPVPLRSSSGLAACLAWRLGSELTYCLDGQVYTAGSAVSWLADLGLIGGAADLDRLGLSVPDSGGAMFVPGLAGLAAPFWRPQATGSFTGLTLGTSRPHLVRAVIEGIAASVAWLARAAQADLGRALEGLRADGGLTRSRVLMQAQADLLQVPVEVSASPHATALGAAALALLGAGGAASAEEALGAAAPAAVYQPSVPGEQAAEHLEAWRQAAEATACLAAPVTMPSLRASGTMPSLRASGTTPSLPASGMALGTSNGG
jgi:glycerol kinase